MHLTCIYVLQNRSKVAILWVKNVRGVFMSHITASSLEGAFMEALLWGLLLFQLRIKYSNL